MTVLFSVRNFSETQEYFLRGCELEVSYDSGVDDSPILFESRKPRFYI